MTESEAFRIVRSAAWARSILLVVSSLVCLIMWTAYVGGMPPKTSPTLTGLDLIDAALGLRFWAWCFGAAGLVGLVAAGTGTRSRWLILIQGALYGFWGMSYFIAWVFYGGRGYVSAAPWVLCELLVFVLLLLPARRR